MKPLTPEEAGKLNAQIAPILRYLHVLCNRFQQRGFPDDERLRFAAEKAELALWQAHDAIHTISVLTHYASLPPGQVPQGGWNA